MFPLIKPRKYIFLIIILIILSEKIINGKFFAPQTLLENEKRQEHSHLVQIIEIILENNSNDNQSLATISIGKHDYLEQLLEHLEHPKHAKGPIDNFFTPSDTDYAAKILKRQNVTSDSVKQFQVYTQAIARLRDPSVFLILGDDAEYFLKMLNYNLYPGLLWNRDALFLVIINADGDVYELFQTLLKFQMTRIVLIVKGSYLANGTDENPTTISLFIPTTINPCRTVELKEIQIQNSSDLNEIENLRIPEMDYSCLLNEPINVYEHVGVFYGYKSASAITTELIVEHLNLNATYLALEDDTNFEFCVSDLARVFKADKNDICSMMFFMGRNMKKYLPYIEYVRYHFLIPRSKPASFWGIVLKMSQYYFYQLELTFLIATVLFFIYNYPRCKGLKHRLSGCFMELYSLSLGYSITIHKNKLKLRIIYFAWIVFSMQFVALIQAYYVSYLTSSPREPQLTTLEQIVQNKTKIVLHTPTEYWFNSLFPQAENLTERPNIWNIFTHGSTVDLDPTKAHCISFMKIFYAENYEHIFNKKWWTLPNIYDDHIPVHLMWPSQFYVFMFALEQHFLTGVFTTLTMRIHASGLLQYFRIKSLMNDEKVFHSDSVGLLRSGKWNFPTNNVETFQVFNMQHFQLPYLILFGGVGLSVLVLMIERKLARLGKFCQNFD